jgi:hypothetical protein
MWLIADTGGIEQPNDSILGQRTHPPDPKSTFSLPAKRALIQGNLTRL